MIILKKLEWSNWFNYGENNSIELNSSNLTQILGVNGAGKSSIPLILEEVLYGKNSKGVVKADLANWNIDKPTLEAHLYMQVDGIDYEIILIRKSSIKLTLIKDGKDISYHTATQTYKAIENILGLNHKIFSQLIYQSSTSNLKFLTATDATRKEFLISLFDLDKYTDIFNTYKSAIKDISSVKSKLEGSISTITSWLSKAETSNKEKLLYLECPADPEDLRTMLADKTNKLNNISKINKEINNNNTYKKMLSGLKPTDDISKEELTKLEDEKELSSRKAVLQNKLLEEKKIISKFKRVGTGICSNCLQEIDKDQIESIISASKLNLDEYTTELLIVTEQLSNILKIKTKKAKIERDKREFEDLWSKIDFELQEESLDIDTLKEEISKINRDIRNIVAKIDEVTEHNRKVTQHNTKVDSIKEQINEYKSDLSKNRRELEDITKVYNNLMTLKKAFSTTGLISYKLEYLVKDLEDTINTYLADLSNGKFLINFSLNGDKLVVNIINNGKEVKINSLSTGQLARVNTATLLAIRKLMSNISKSKINVLFLDETISVLDTYGRDTLIDMLLQENELNTFLVSHEYSHPLLTKVEVVIKDGKSAIENG